MIPTRPPARHGPADAGALKAPGDAALETPSTLRAGIAYWTGLALALGLLAVTVPWMDGLHARRLQDAADRRAREDLELIRGIVLEALQNGERGDVATTLTVWGRTRKDTVELKLTAANGRVLGRYRRGRPRPGPDARHFSMRIPSGFSGAATLQLTEDLVSVARAQTLYRLETGALAGLLGLSLALLAWAAARRRRERLEHRLESWRLEQARGSEADALGRARRLRALLDGMLDSLPAMVIGVNAEGRIIEWSRNAAEHTRIAREDALGLPLRELMPHLESQVERLHQEGAASRPQRSSRITEVANGTVRYADVAIRPLAPEIGGGALIRVEDITARVRAEQMMVQSERLVALGGLAACVAHELNSPLSGVMQNAQNVLRRLSPELPANRQAAAETGVNLEHLQHYLERRKIREFLDLAREAADRAGGIVSDMLAFSRQGGEAQEKVAAKELLETALRLAANNYETKEKLEFHRVQVERDYAPRLPMLHCHRTRMEQALLNLIKNAVQAMHHANTPAPRRLLLRTAMEDGRLCLEVADNGPGMTPEVRMRVFEPFFSAGASGQATGLGLAVADYIVSEYHHGSIGVESEPGRGSRFRICLPLGTDAGAVTDQGFSQSRTAAHADFTA